MYYWTLSTGHFVKLKREERERGGERERERERRERGRERERERERKRERGEREKGGPPYLQIPVHDRVIMAIGDRFQDLLDAVTGKER